MDWEILEVEIETKKHTLLGTGNCVLKDQKLERMSRVRVVINGRLGISFSPWGAMSLDQQLDQAMEKAVRGPKIAWVLSQKEDNSSKEPFPNNESAFDQLNLCPTGIVVIESRKIKSKLLYHSGYSLQQDNFQSLATISLGNMRHIIPIARVDIGSRPDSSHFTNSIELVQDYNETRLLDVPWLFSPIALSKIALRTWHEFLIADDKYGMAFPAGLWLQDKGDMFRTDFEGTTCRPVTFVFNGELITKAHNRISADLANAKPTGHGGLCGRFVWDMCVGPSSFDLYNLFPTSPSHVVISDAYPFNCQQEKDFLLSISIVFDNKRCPINVLVKLKSISDLFEASMWCGPTQFGIKQWSSPWLELMEPKKIFCLL